jgi:hypothetical protein
MEIVPTIAGKMPPLLMPSLGMAVRNSQDMAEIPFLTMTKMMAMIGIMASVVAQSKRQIANF